MKISSSDDAGISIVEKGKILKLSCSGGASSADANPDGFAFFSFRASRSAPFSPRGAPLLLESSLAALRLPRLLGAIGGTSLEATFLLPELSSGLSSSPKLPSLSSLSSFSMKSLSSATAFVGLAQEEDRLLSRDPPMSLRFPERPLPLPRPRPLRLPGRLRTRGFRSLGSS